VINSTLNMPSLPRACIHLERLRKNVSLVHGRVPGHVRIMGVVKCDAYGHGAVPVSETMIEAGVRELVVSNIAEGLALRKAGISCPVLVLSDPLHPCLQDALDHDLNITVSDAGFAGKIINFPTRHGQTFHVHVKIDTGLARFGLTPDQAPEVIAGLSRSKHIKVVGIYSHLACTFKDDIKSNSFTRLQIKVFNSVLSRLESLRLLPPVIHFGSSTGLLGFQKELCSGWFNALRIGTLFYGFTERSHDWDELPTPAAEVTTRILQVRDVKAGSYVGYHLASRMPHAGRTAVISGGLYHGLHGDSSLMPACMVHGRMAPVIGKLSMAQCIIDVSNIPEAKAGSKVLLAGQKINMHRLALSIGRGTWELFLPLLSNAYKTYIDP
jgi:alanine racemase